MTYLSQHAQVAPEDRQTFLTAVGELGQLIQNNDLSPRKLEQLATRLDRSQIAAAADGSSSAAVNLLTGPAEAALERNRAHLSQVYTRHEAAGANVSPRLAAEYKAAWAKHAGTAAVHQMVDVGPIEATADDKETVPIPPILAGLALVGGVVLVAASARRT